MSELLHYPGKMAAIPAKWQLALTFILAGPVMTFAAPFDLPIIASPPSFEPSSDGKFILRTGRAVVVFQPDASITIQAGTTVNAEAVTMRVRGAQSTGISGELPQPRQLVYQGVAQGGHLAQTTYGRLRYRAVFPGIDLVFRFHAKTLEYDFEIAPGASPEVIRLRFSQPGRIRKDGRLRINGSAGEILQTRPVSFQTKSNGATKNVSSRYRMWPDGTVSFAIGKFDSSLVLTIDPAILFGSYLGGSGFDRVNAVATDASHNIYLGGDTQSLDFPPSTGLSGQLRASTDAFVVKLNSSGRFLYSAIMSGSGYDSVSSIAVDGSGNVYVTGVTGSPDFPTTLGAFQTVLPGIQDAFVAKLSPSLALVYSTYMGGGSNDRGAAIALDGTGSAYVAGSTSSVNFPTTSGAFRRTYQGGLSDCFVAKLNATGSALVYATLLGGENLDVCAGVAVDSAGEAVVTGSTASTLFPVQAAIQSVLNGTSNVFVAKLAQNGASLLFSTYLGGSNIDQGSSVALDANGNIYFAGATSSFDFPVSAGAYQTTLRGLYDGFLCKIAPNGSAILFSTLLGGTGSELITDLFIDTSGQPVVSGYTTSIDFPVQNALQAVPGGNFDGFAAVFDASAATLTYSTYIGGGGDDRSYGVASMGTPSLVVAGQALSGDISYLQYLYSTTPRGQYDGFVLALPYGPVPTLASFSPASGSGSSQVFTQVLNDSAGGGDIFGAQVLINSTLNGAQACYFGYQSAGNQLRLVNDAGSAWVPGVVSPGSGSVSNSQCTLEGAGSSIAVSGDQLTLNYSIQFQASFAGTKGIWNQATSTASGMLSAWQSEINGSQLNWTVTAPLPPVAVSLSPANGSGQSQTFAATYSDAAGAAVIATAYMLVGGAVTSAGSCWLEFNAGNNTFSLMNDAGTAWSAPVNIGSGTVSNSQCTFSGTGAGATPSGNNLTVNFPLTFAAGYAGPQNVYLNVADQSGLNSGWQQFGAFTITTGVPPAAGSVLPANGSGQSQTFTATYSDVNGAAAIATAYLVIGSLATGAGNCWLQFNASSNTFNLLNDAGTAYSAPVSIGSGTIGNSQCTFSGAGAGATPSGNNLTVDFPLTFATRYAGTQNVYLDVIDGNGLTSGWVQLGSFTVTGGGPVPVCAGPGTPCVISLTPGNGSGLSGSFTGVFTRSAAGPALYLGYILFLPTPNVVQYTATGSCLVEYNSIDNAMRLINDAGSNWLPGPVGVPLSKGGSLTNSHCTVDVTQSKAVVSGTTMTVTAAVTFNSSFSGELATFMQGFDITGVFTGMTQFGNWVADAGVQKPGPYIVGMTPTSGAGSSVTLSLTAGDTKGVSALAFVAMLISPVIEGAPACQAYYFPDPNTINLINDAGSAFVSPVGIVPGTAGTLANSLCSIDTGSASSSHTADNATVNLPMTFDPGTFGGVKNIYLVSFDGVGNLSHWVTSATWTVQ